MLAQVVSAILQIRVFVSITLGCLATALVGQFLAWRIPLCLSRTEFGENEIGHRSAFGKKWYRKYSDIDEVKYSGSNLRLRFSDCIVLVVARTDGDLVAIGDHVIEQAGLESEFPDVDPKHLAVGTWIRRS